MIQCLAAIPDPKADRGINSKQLILAAMNHEEPDRVPVMCQLALGDYFLNCSFSPSEIWFDSETFAKALVDLQKRYGFDGILVNIAGRCIKNSCLLMKMRFFGLYEITA